MAYSTASSQVPSKIDAVYRRVTPVTPTNGLAIGPFMGFIVAVGGVIQLVPLGQATPVPITVIAGALYQIAFQGVEATSTTATGIVGLG